MLEKVIVQPPYPSFFWYWILSRDGNWKNHRAWRGWDPRGMCLCLDSMMLREQIFWFAVIPNCNNAMMPWNLIPNLPTTSQTRSKEIYFFHADDILRMNFLGPPLVASGGGCLMFLMRLWVEHFLRKLAFLNFQLARLCVQEDAKFASHLPAKFGAAFCCSRQTTMTVLFICASSLIASHRFHG